MRELENEHGDIAILTRVRQSRCEEGPGADCVILVCGFTDCFPQRVYVHAPTIAAVSEPREVPGTVLGCTLYLIVTLVDSTLEHGTPFAYT